MEMNQLTQITDVTQQVQAATKDTPPAQFEAVQKATIAAIEKQCATSDDVRCEVVSLYRGGRYDLYTYRRLQDDRDVRLPAYLIRLGELRGMLTEYQRRGAEETRHSNDMLFGVENGLKALKGRHDALADRAFYGQLVRDEADFRARVKADPALQAEYGDTWDQIAALTVKEQALRKRYFALEGRTGSQLFRWART